MAYIHIHQPEPERLLTMNKTILDRIIKLRTLGERASNMNEAEVALRMANQLMEAYDLEEADLALHETSDEARVNIVHEDVKAGYNGRTRSKGMACFPAVAKLTNVQMVTTPWTKAITLVGHDTDVELAKYFISIIESSLDRSYTAWKKDQAAGTLGRNAKGTFQLAMALRIIRTLNGMIDDKERAAGATARVYDKNPQYITQAVAADLAPSDKALLVIGMRNDKAEAVNAKFKELFPDLRKGTPITSRGGSANAYSAGTAAGSRVSFNRGVGGSAQLALGSR